MQFSDVTNKQGLVQDIDFWVKTNSTSYPLADKARAINEYLKSVNTLIWEASAKWEYDDSNHSDLPVATANLVAGQQDYTLPEAMQKLIRVSVKDNDGNAILLTPLDQSDISGAMSEYRETDGLPRSYDLIGRSLMLYPAPAAADVTLVEGLSVYVSREVEQFVATDTTDEPGFNEDFHRILSIGAAFDYAVANNMTERINDLRNALEEYKTRLQTFYGGRQHGKAMRMKVKQLNTI